MLNAVTSVDQNLDVGNCQPFISTIVMLYAQISGVKLTTEEWSVNNVYEVTLNIADY